MNDLRTQRIAIELADWVKKLDLKNSAESIAMIAELVAESVRTLNADTLAKALPLYVSGKLYKVPNHYGKITPEWVVKVYNETQAYEARMVINEPQRLISTNPDPLPSEVNTIMGGWLTECKNQVSKSGRITFVTVAPLYEWLEKNGRAPFDEKELSQFRDKACKYINALSSSNPFEKAMNLDGHRGVEKRIKHYALERAIELGII